MIDIKVIIDKDFAMQYFEGTNTSGPVYADFEQEFLCTAATKTLISNYSDKEEFFQAASDNPLLESLAECIPNLEIREWGDKIKIVHELSEGSGFKIFLMDLPDQDCVDLTYETGYLIANPKNLSTLWERYIDKTHYLELDLPASSKEENVFRTWDDLGFVGKSPGNTIIIQDNYILADKLEKISENLLPLIESLMPVGLSKEVDILIISERIKENEKNKSLKEKATQIHNFLHSRLARFENIKVNISLVYHHSAFNPEDNPDFHDRNIYTNYYALECGKGFNLFRGKKRISSNSHITINFILQSRQMKVLPRRLEAIAKYIDKLKRVETLEGFKYYPEIKCSILGYG